MKKFKYLMVVFLSFICLIGFARANSIEIKSSNSTVTKGNSLTITATVSSDAPIVSIEGTLMCKGAGVSSGVDLNFDDFSNSLYSKSYTTTVKTSSSGTLTCSTTGVRITNMSSGNWHNISNKSINITVKEPTTIPAKTYSSNNYLKNLEIDGYNLTPVFKRDVLEYSLEVPHETIKVNVKATTEDSKATLSGVGEKEVTEGVNKLEIKITAENGNERIYIINVKVKELDPIEITIDNKKYTIIRQEGILDVPENYEKSSIKIEDTDIICYKNIVTNNILIGLKDEDGNAKFYSYNVENNSYEEYHGYKIGGLSLNILSMPDDIVPEGYYKTSFNYDGTDLIGYQYETTDENDFYLIYAVNEITGEEGLYVYDELENTVQRYNDEIVESSQKRINSYQIYLIVAGVLLVGLIITLLIILIKRRDRHKRRTI